MAPKLAVSMSSLSQSYSHWKSCNSESINSRGCLPNKGGSILAFFGLVRPGKTHMHISLTAAAQSFTWNIWLQETRLKMICTSEPVTTFSVLLISQFLFLLINPQKSIKGSFSRVLNTILFNVNICMGYLMLTSTQHRTWHNRHSITLRQPKVVKYHNFGMPLRLSNLTNNRHQCKRKQRNNFIISRLGLFLDEVLFSSVLAEKSYIEIT